MNNTKFDLDLKFGQQFEQEFADIFGGNQKVEIKTERGMWARTGNLAFERRYKDKPSGLDVTESKWWAHILVLNQKIVGMLIFDVEILKKKLDTLYFHGKVKIVSGGDNQDSELWLVSLNDIKDLFLINPFFNV